MGSAARRKPKRLAEKLLEIRMGFALSQNGLIRQMGSVTILLRRKSVCSNEGFASQVC